MKKSYKILIIGLGSIGCRHLKNLLKLGVNNLLVYRSKKTLQSQKFDQRYGTKTFYSIKQALRQKPDAVFVTNPTHLHVKFALLAAQAGCHLFIEKPLSHSLKNINKLIRQAEKNKLITLVGCNQRFHSHLNRIKKLVEQNKIGKIFSARFAVGQYLPDWHPGEDYKKSYAATKSMGGGVILTLIHEIDYAYWLLGEVNKLVCLSDRSGILKISVEDNAEILLQTKDKTLIEIHLDYLQRTLTRQYQLYGEKGSIIWDYDKSKLSIYSIKNKKWKTISLGVYDRNQMYVQEIKHFLNCLNHKEKSINPINEAEKVLKIALAAKKSAHQNRIINKI